ncbi:hypothetical protein H4582DRAFT_866679 [Lactarius indigo]|nr:hypothetical protein H4582DRAFT_866679 [Lactarius indigo]
MVGGNVFNQRTPLRFRGSLDSSLIPILRRFWHQFAVTVLVAKSISSPFARSPPGVLCRSEGIKCPLPNVESLSVQNTSYSSKHTRYSSREKPTMSSNPDYILILNNYLQRTGEAHLLSWEFSQIGPEHQATHTAVAKLSGYPISQGSATTRAIARQIASYNFLKGRKQI